jgi:hypothetical protein
LHQVRTSRISEWYQNLAFEFGSGYKGTSEVEALGAGFTDEFAVGIQ